MTISNLGQSAHLAGPRPRMEGNNHLSAIMGCMDYLGVEVDRAWLYGISGYAFLINIPPGVCCSGPTAWAWDRICQRLPAAGIDASQYVLSFMKRDPGFAQAKQRAIAFTREQYDRGVPLYGAEFGYPEFYTIGDIDEGGFTYVYRNELDGTWATVHRTWEAFGTIDVGILFVGAVRRFETVVEPRIAIADSLDFALAVGTAPAGYLGGATMGLRAYDAWIAGLRDRAALAEGPWNHPDGTTYNAGFWSDARRSAAEFLRSCSPKLDGRLSSEFAQAADRYSQVAAQLERVHELFPYGMDPALPSVEVVEQAADCLCQAAAAENDGLALLAEIRRML